MGFDWKKTLGTVAPMLATALGGPMGGVATKVALEALGLDAAGGEDAVAAAVASGDPNVLLKLKEAENTFELEMKKLDVDMEKLKVQVYSKDVEDRGSARALAKVKGVTPHSIISTIFIAGFIYVLTVIFGGGQQTVSEQMMPAAMYLLGILSANLAQIMNFWFGSSAGSKEKTSELAKLVKK